MDWDTALRSIVDSGYVRATVVVAALIGLLLKLQSTRRLKKSRQIRGHSDNITILSLSSEEENPLELRYKGERIPNATVSTVRIWNSGSEEVRRADLPISDPLRIVLPTDAKILEFSILKQSRDANQVQAILKAPNVLETTFEFLNPRQGAVIRLLHTGGHDSEATLHGDLIGPQGDVKSEQTRRFFIGGIDGTQSYIVMSQKSASVAGTILLGFIGALCLLAAWLKSQNMMLLVAVLTLLLALWGLIPSGSQIPRELR